MFMQSGGAILGTNSSATVTIARSGYPNGKFGWRGSLALTIAKPAMLTTVLVAIERTGGLQGQQMVSQHCV